MLLMTETNLDVFHAQLLAPQDAPALDQLCAACGTPGGPDTAALLQTNAVLGDYAGTDTLQGRHGHAAHVWPKPSGARAARSWLWGGRPGHCAGTARLYRAVPAGAALLAMALGLAKQRCASYHIWAVLPLTPPRTARNYAPNIWHLALPCAPWCRWTASSCWCLRPTPRWAAAARCAAYTCRTPPCRAFWSAAAPWQILAGINRALSSACGEWNKETDACRRFL